MSEYTWKQILGLIAVQTDLNDDQAKWAMNEIMSGQATPAHIAAFVMGLRVKNETVEEIAGMVEAILANAQRVTLDRDAVDIVGTGGDGAHTVNVSTMAALTVAGLGIPVLKHGNRAISSRSGTADVLEALGVSLNIPTDAVAACVEEAGIAFCFAPSHHPGFRHAGPVRKELGILTVFNVLGPLCNPGQPPASLLGCADLQMAPLLAHVQHERGFKSIVVRADNGIDEIATQGTTQIWDVTTDEVRHEIFDPSVFDLVPATADDLRGAEAQFNADVVRELFGGKSDGKFAAIRDVVAVNAAAALVAFDSTRANHTYGNPEVTFSARLRVALPDAYRSIDTGLAADALSALVAATATLATPQ